MPRGDLVGRGSMLSIGGGAGSKKNDSSGGGVSYTSGGYLPVDTRDWPISSEGSKHELQRKREKRMRNMADVEVAVGDDLRRKPYSMASLDNDWYAVLGGIQRVDSRGQDNPDAVAGFGPSPESGPGLSSSVARPSGDDDIDGRGSFEARELERELRRMRRGELQNLGISWHRLRDIIQRSDYDGDGVVHYKDFLETVQSYRLTTEQSSGFVKLVKGFAYAEEFTCNPPTVFMLAITALQTGFFVYLSVHLSDAHGLEITWDGPVPYCSVLIYNPYRRWEAWRYLTYMFVHIGIAHYVFNMIMQLLVGVFLEMEQEGWIGSLRVLAVYLAGVLAGSLGTSLTDPNTYVAGASGGVYSLIAAHLATVLINWSEDNTVKIRKVIHTPLTRTVRITFIVILTMHDVAIAVYSKYFSDAPNRTGFMGHLCGACAGLLVGVFALQNRRVRKWEPVMQWICLAIFMLLVTFAVVWNIFANTWVPGYYPESDYRLYDDESGNCKHYDYF